jgi:hypothetical protein
LKIFVVMIVDVSQPFRCRGRAMLGRLDSNQRMPGSKPGALPTWLRPIESRLACQRL